MNKIGIFLAAFALVGGSSKAQTPVTRAITDFNGFWSSQVGSINPVQPDSSHMLLGFKYGSTLFSTGVADSILTLNNVPFESALFNAFQPATTTIMRDNSTVIGVGYKYGGPGNVNPIPVTNAFSQYLQDGIRGLDLGTAVFNTVPSNILYTIDATNDTAIGDGRPDILVTQVGEPPISSKSDSFRFIDANGLTVGHAVAVSVSGLSIIGNASWKFYNTDQPMTYNSGLLGSRPLRMVAFDFADFGINLSNIASIKHFVHRVSGESDQAFIAYNTTSFSPQTGQPLPVTLSYFSAEKSGQTALLKWSVASAENFSSFVIERSGANNLFDAIGEVKYVSSINDYTFVDPLPAPGINLYRLKMIDKDQQMKISTIKRLDYSNRNLNEVTIFPNPVTNVMTIESLNADDQVSFLNSSGNLIANIFRHGNIFDLSRLAPGVYTVIINKPGVPSESKIIIKK